MTAGGDGFDRSMLEIERLIAELESQPDSEVIEQARALVQAVLEVHAIGLGAILERLQAEPSPALCRDLGRDARIAALLSLHGLGTGLDVSEARVAPVAVAESPAALVPVARLLKLAGGQER